MKSSVVESDFTHYKHLNPRVKINQFHSFFIQNYCEFLTNFYVTTCSAKHILSHSDDGVSEEIERTRRWWWPSTVAENNLMSL